MALAGIYSGLASDGRPPLRLILPVPRCGRGRLGIGDLIVTALIAERMPEADARRRCWFVDSKGLIVRGPHRSGPAQDPTPTRAICTRFAGRRRAAQAQRDHRHLGHGGRFHPAGGRGDGAFQRTTHHLRAVQSHVQVRAYGGGGVGVVERARTVRERQPVRAGPPERPHLCPGPGQQRLHLPRHRPRRDRRGGETYHRRDVLRRGQDPGEPGHGVRSRSRPPLPPVHAHPPRIGSHRDGSGRAGLRARPCTTPTTRRSRRVRAIADVRAGVSQLRGRGRRIGARRGAGNPRCRGGGQCQFRTQRLMPR